MIPLALTPEQRRQARSGAIILTEDQIVSAGARRAIAKRVFVTSPDGLRKLIKNAAAKRLPYYAAQRCVRHSAGSTSVD